MNYRSFVYGLGFFIIICDLVNAATMGQINKDIFAEEINQSIPPHSSYKQAQTDISDEDSDEDDEVEDAEVQHHNISQQQHNEDVSVEDSEEEEEADDVRRFYATHRMRRNIMESEENQAGIREENRTVTTSKTEEPSYTSVIKINDPKIDEVEEKWSNISSTAVSSVNTPDRSSVLILIRDVLKKVITEIPTEQVATNALQYFQLFEHFLQQSIEQVIDEDDDDDEETTTIESEINISPEETTIIPQMETFHEINPTIDKLSTENKTRFLNNGENTL